MRSTAKGLSGGAVCALALMGWMCNPQGAAAADNAAARALAEKFSRAAEDSERANDAKQAEAERARAKAQAAEAEAEQIRAEAQAEAARRKAAEQRAADEADMLRNAEAEAESRRAHDQKAEAARIEGERQAARAEAQRLVKEAQQARREKEQRAEEARKAEAARLAREVEEQRLAEEKRLADERRIAEEKRQAEKKAEEARQAEAARLAREAEQARVAEEKRIAEEKRADEARRAEAARLAREAEQARIAERQRQADEARLAEERAALEAKRMEEAQRIAEKFRLAREARERDKEARNSLGGPLPEEPSSPFIEAPATAQATYPARVTVLLIIQPRRPGFGGVKMTANPVLCLGQSCYVSGGAEAAATLMPRMRALGPGNTLGRQAGACRDQVTCVFRGVALGAPSSQIQPVDMGFLRHDRKEVRSAEPDRSCDVSGGRLYCSAPIVTRGYRAWIVPEIIAQKAGTNALERALDDGLPMARSASYDGWGSTVHALPNR